MVSESLSIIIIEVFCQTYVAAISGASAQVNNETVRKCLIQAGRSHHRDDTSLPGLGIVTSCCDYTANTRDGSVS